MATGTRHSQLPGLWLGGDHGRARPLAEPAVARDALPEEPAHGVVYGQKKRGGIGGKLRDDAVWVVMPIQSEMG